MVSDPRGQRQAIGLQAGEHLAGALGLIPGEADELRAVDGRALNAGGFHPAQTSGELRHIAEWGGQKMALGITPGPECTQLDAPGLIGGAPGAGVGNFDG